jgi:hypothetical protein
MLALGQHTFLGAACAQNSFSVQGIEREFAERAWSLFSSERLKSVRAALVLEVRSDQACCECHLSLKPLSMSLSL